jgi:hypothetical protein
MGHQGGVWELSSHGRFSMLERLPLRDVISHGKQNNFTLACGSQLMSSEPRDYVNSWFGRISDIEGMRLRVDHTKSVEEVYTDFAEAIIRVGKTNWLNICWRTSSRYGTLPS